MTTLNQSAPQPNTAIEKREAPTYYKTLGSFSRCLNRKGHPGMTTDHSHLLPPSVKTVTSSVNRLETRRNETKEKTR